MWMTVGERRFAITLADSEVARAFAAATIARRKEHHQCADDRHKQCGQPGETVHAEVQFQRLPASPGPDEAGRAALELFGCSAGCLLTLDLTERHDPIPNKVTICHAG